ncbi:MAG: acetyl-CoA C-acyltransferase, partial [Terracidiphilus sp.]
MREAVIVSAARTPIGKFQGALSPFTAPKLGAIAVREAVRRAGVEPADVEECIMGCVLQAGLGQNPARQAAIHGGMPAESAALTVNQVCGSGLRAVALCAQAVWCGDAEIMVGGGMESMSNAPYLLAQARTGYRMGNGTLVDAMIHDGLWEAYRGFHMGVGAEMIAEKYGIGRGEQDAFAAGSHQKAAKATAEGWFRSGIVAVEIPATKKGEAPRIFDKDETIRPETSAEILAKLKPAFKEGGTVTAGNAPGVSDGAAAVVVM